MNGVIIWAQSDCRSTMGLYEALIKAVGVPAVIALWFYHKTENYVDNRMEIGFSGREFAHVPTIPVGEDYEKGVKVLNDHPGYVHLFTVYQNAPVWRRLIMEANRRGEKVVVACEAPCNMEKGWRFLAKELYLRFVLKRRVLPVVRTAKAFVNYSGGDDKYARIIGWPKKKIVPFGYYSPPIPGSRCVPRLGNRPFHILATGVLSGYRGADVLVEALRLLKARGVSYRATITQKGELLDGLMAKARKYDLPIDFPGVVSMPDLIRLYETCSVYVGAGRHEPWGMRLNDALNCGTPLVVSRGMGGVKMVDESGCGLAFRRGDAKGLADQLQRLATDGGLYKNCAARAVVAASRYSPQQQAAVLWRTLERVLGDG